jgi:hypothetical protein
MQALFDSLVAEPGDIQNYVIAVEKPAAPFNFSTAHFAVCLAFSVAVSSISQTNRLYAQLSEP